MPRCRRFLEGEQRLAGNPAVLDGEVPRLRLLALADDDFDAVVFHVERLAAALHAVAEDGDRLVAQDFAASAPADSRPAPPPFL